ncbi:MAG: TrkA family potassium uptake protein [Spirochaetaceae bacterium]|jgi:trk system potassium uptake protein TrkA|nr:TrkA family potassium uptake protein [Spirochaetaceae bacterium]
MKQVAILGLSHFGKSVLDELVRLNVEVFVMDKDRDRIDQYKDLASGSVIIDVLNVENLRKVLPESTDAVVIDMGDSIEASILAASYCAKLRIKTIIVKAETESHGEILELVGATQVVFPNKEAAKRVSPLLLSSVLLNYLPVSGKLVIAELAIPDSMTGKTIMQAELRKKHGLNLISVRTEDEEFDEFNPSHIFQKGDIGLFSGTDEALGAFTGTIIREEKHSTLRAQILKLFRKEKKNSEQ